MRYLAAILLLLTANICRSQSNFNGWFGAFNTFKLNSRFSVHLDVQVRSTNQLNHLNTYFFRPGLNFHFRKNMIATVGYGYFESRRMIGGVSGYGPEHRIWEQLIINHNAWFVPVQHRFRLEQRFIGNNQLVNGDLVNSGNRFANRIRYFNRNILPFSGSKTFRKGMFGAIQNEIFINLGNKSGVNGKTFDQNRFYLATGYRFSPKFDVEAGYMNVYISGAGNSFSNNHIAQIATYLRL